MEKIAFNEEGKIFLPPVHQPLEQNHPSVSAWFFCLGLMAPCSWPPRRHFSQDHDSISAEKCPKCASSRSSASTGPEGPSCFPVPCPPASKPCLSWGFHHGVGGPWGPHSDEKFGLENADSQKEPTACTGLVTENGLQLWPTRCSYLDSSFQNLTHP